MSFNGCARSSCEKKRFALSTDASAERSSRSKENHSSKLNAASAWHRTWQFLGLHDHQRLRKALCLPKCFVQRGLLLLTMNLWQHMHLPLWVASLAFLRCPIANLIVVEQQSAAPFSYCCCHCWP